MQRQSGRSRAFPPLDREIQVDAGFLTKNTNGLSNLSGRQELSTSVNLILRMRSAKCMP